MASPARIFFRLAFGLSWGIGGLGLLTGGLPVTSPLYYLAAYAVSLSGLALTAREGRLGELPRRLKPAWGWAAVVVLGYAAITAVVGPRVDWAALGAGLLPTLWRDAGPLGEEFGWRGYAMPKLLETHAPLRASLILGTMHALWHLPLFFMPSMPQSQLSFPVFAMGPLAMAVFDTALYLRVTEGDVFLAILVHLLANACATALGPGLFPYFAAAQGVLALGVVLRGGLKKGLRS